MVKRGLISIFILLLILTQAACLTSIQTVEVTRIIPQTIIVLQTVQVTTTPFQPTETPEVLAFTPTASPRSGLPANVSRENLIAFFPFNGNVNDESGNGHKSILHNATLAEDRFGLPSSAYYFDGIDDFILVPTLNEFGSQLESFTICLWLKTEFNDSPQWRSVINTINNGQNTLLAIELNRSASSYLYEPKMTLFVLRGNGNKNLRGNITTDIYDGKWHYLQWRVSSASNNDFDVYVDGVKQTLIYVTRESPRFSNFEFPIVIGGENNRGVVDRPYYGYLDDIVIFGRALSEDELLALYNFR